jgi:ParB family chromosome partitioning protein
VSRGAGKKPGALTEDDADAAALASDLSEALGLDVSIRLSTPTSGALLISYRTLEQLDDVCRRLMSPR